MRFADWLEQVQGLGVARAEIDAAAAVEARLRVASVIARERLGAPTEAAVLAVFAQIERAETAAR